MTFCVSNLKGIRIWNIPKMISPPHTMLKGKTAFMQDNRNPEVSGQPGAYWSKLHCNYKSLMLNFIEKFIVYDLLLNFSRELLHWY